MPRVNSEGARAWCEDCNFDQVYRDAQYAAVAAGKHRTGRCDEPWPTCGLCGYIPRAANRSGADQSLRRHLAARACWGPRSQGPIPELRCLHCGWVSLAAHRRERRRAVRRHLASKACWRHRYRSRQPDRYTVMARRAGYRVRTDAEWVAHFNAFPEVYAMLWAQVYRGWGLRELYPAMMTERAALKAARARVPAQRTG